jgi:hypothetical protein
MKALSTFVLFLIINIVGYTQGECTRPSVEGPRKVCKGAVIELIGSNPSEFGASWEILDNVTLTNGGGFFLGNQIGESKIVYTDKNGCKDTVKVQVNPVPTIEGITILCEKVSSKFSSANSPALNSAWISSDANIADLDPITGEVIAIGAGVASIYFTDINGCSASTVVTVKHTPVLDLGFTEKRICSGSSINILLINPLNDVIYDWRVVQSGVVGLNDSLGVANGTIINQVADLEQGVSGGYAMFSITPMLEECVGLSEIVRVNVESYENPLFEYTSEGKFCKTDAYPSPIIKGVRGGTFKSLSTSVFLDNSNGRINLDNSVQGTYQIRYTTPGLCKDSSEVSITILPIPEVNNVSDRSICDGEVSSEIQLSGKDISRVDWVSSSNVIGLNSSGSDLIPSFQASGTTAGGAAIFSTITMTPYIDKCKGSTKSFVITVNSKDSVNFAYSATNFCASESPVNPSQTGNSTGVFSSSPQGLDINPSNGKIIVQNSTPGDYIIKYISSGYCKSELTQALSIKQQPYVASIPDQIICKGNTFNAINFSGSSETVFNWVNNDATIGLPLSGSGSIPSFQGVTPVSSVIQVTPVSGECVGESKLFTLTINELDSINFSYSKGEYCLGESNPTPAFSGLLGGVYTSDNEGIVLNSTTGIINLETSKEGIYQVTYRSSGSCLNQKTQSVEIIGIPVVNELMNQLACQNSFFDTIKFNGNATVFEWINSNQSVGLSTSGIGDIPSFKALGLKGQIISSTLTVTPQIKSCRGQSTSFSFIVNPLDDATFTIYDTVFCPTIELASPRVTGLKGGVFSSKSGLVVNMFSGEIDLKKSTIGNHVLTYTTKGLCKNESSKNILIKSLTQLTFDSISPLCKGDVFSLSPNSNEGVAGSWFPPVNFDQSTVYTFTPVTEVCASAFQLLVEIKEKVTPTFSIDSVFCSGKIESPLVSISNESVVGKWVPIWNSNVTQAYTFLPSPNECANTKELVIKIQPTITPIFDLFAPICKGDTFSLPLKSKNGIFGQWSPSIVDNQTSKSYIFVPKEVLCAQSKSMDLVVNELPDPFFIMPHFVEINDQPVTFVPNVPGGKFYLKGKEITQLRPMELGLGVKSVTYELTGSNNTCFSSRTQDILVFDSTSTVCKKYDTIRITVYDTSKINVYDTLYVNKTVTDTVSILKIKVKITTGLNSITENTVSIYPNPTSDKLIIDNGMYTLMYKYTVHIYDPSGKLVYTRLVNAQQFEVSLRDLGESGTYLFHLKDDKNTLIATRKIVLN